MSLGAFFDSRRDEAPELLSQIFAPRVAEVGALIARNNNLEYVVEQSAVLCVRSISGHCSPKRKKKLT